MRRQFLALFALLAGLFATGAAEAQNRFWLVNESGRVIQSAYVSSSRVQDWGPDILGASVLPPGNRVWVTPNFGDCVLDIRVTYQGGGEETRMQTNACNLSQVVFSGRVGAAPGTGAGAGATVSPGAVASGNPSFNFVNQSGAVIREIYVSLSTQNAWGSDRLGANVLQPGQQVAINLPTGGGCLVDMRVVYMDGRAAERRRVETCSITGFGWR
jgi:hypothetical protein